ncbi:acyl-CoA dehydrogenase [uncultured Microscilla sp.]|uniref:acyl-CoA dehydrogenase family protein n=1 Tax=uncultured Microscilla sp. TaxID=432653 RepID=UPI00263496C7|nr:acyl-CoA dehydrogenase [uncultured Microscilla sp.]
MALIINEEQQMLKTSAAEFLKEKAPVAALRKLRDEKNQQGYDQALWQQMAEMGWASLVIPEQYGGLDFGYVGLGQLLEEMGRTLTASPMVSTGLVGAHAILLAGNAAQKERLLPAIGAGELIVTLAIDERRQHHPAKTTMSAVKQGNEYVLNGKKVFVLDGQVANQLIVVARTAGKAGDEAGLTMFLVDAQAQGIEIGHQQMMDSRNAATISFENVKAAEVLGQVDQGFEVLTQVLDIACIGISAEMLGTMCEAFERTVKYLKERKQFGVPIGSFQALQHRAALMYGEIEICKSMVIKALQAIDQNNPDLSRMASMTKAKIGETIRLVTNEAIQMFGGIGMTDDEEIGFFMKRARVAQVTFGDYNYHLDRYARLLGF